MDTQKLMFETVLEHVKSTTIHLRLIIAELDPKACARRPLRGYISLYWKY